MRTHIIRSLNDAGQIKGTAVVIDVLRAFTTACYLFANGAERIIPIADIEEARQLKINDPTVLLIGERSGIKPIDFDWGNSPAELEHQSFLGKTIIFTTSAGTQGIHKALHADEILTGSFANSHAIASYLIKTSPSDVSFLCTDDRFPMNEDYLCATYIESLLLGKPVNFRQIKNHLEKHPSADGFLNNPMTKWSKKDFQLCLSCDTFTFIVRAVKTNPVRLEKL